MQTTKTLLLTCLLFLGMVLSKTANAQGNEPLTPKAMLDTIHDMFGNKKTLRDIMFQYSNSSSSGTNYMMAAATTSSSCGYFNVYYAAGCGMELTANTQHANRRAVICQVLSDLSAFINTPNPLVRVNILIDQESAASSIGALGVASGYYAQASSPSFAAPGIADNEIWKTIHTGVDSYTGVAPPVNLSINGFYHGFMAFDFNNNWNDLLTTATTATQFDLYTVALHEITHALGFASLISSTGTSKFGTSGNYFSRYDLFLRNKTSLPLLTNVGAPSPMYGQTFNTAVSTAELQPAATCTNDVVFAGTVNQKCFTPSSFSNGSSLSHLEDICHTPTPYALGTYYVMNSGTTAGIMKRFLKQEERDVLCDLGYNTNNTYGNTANFTYTTYTGACAGVQVGGINDGINSLGSYIYTTTNSSSTSTVINIPIPQVLANDYATAMPLNISGVQNCYSTSGTASVVGANIVFTTSMGYTGPILLRYVPRDNNNVPGNITYIYAFVYPTGCTPVNPCDMVQNGGFENVSGSSSCGNLGSGVYENCWYEYKDTPDIFSNGCTTPGGFNLGVNTFSSNPIWVHPPSAGNTILGLYAGNVAGGNYNEALQNFLSAPLTVGTVYQLKFKYYNYSGNLIYPSTGMSFAINNAPAITPCIFTIASNTTIAVASSYPNASLSSILTETLSNINTWTNVSTTFTYTGTNAANVLLLGINLQANIAAGYNLTNGNPKNFYILIDDVSLLPAGITPTLTIPNVCQGSSITDLSLYANPGGGTFSGTGVTYSGGTYNFNSPATLSAGTYSVTYTYTNGINCVYSAVQTVTVHPTPTITITPTSPTITTVCSGAVSVLTGSGASTYTWAAPACTSGCNTAVKGFVVNATTIYTLNGTNAQGCVGTNTIQITAVPKPTVTVTSATICAGQSATLTASGANTYIWNPGASTASSIVVAPSVTTIYTVTGQNTGCTASSVKTATVTIAPNIPVFTITPPTLPIVSNVTGTNTVGFTSSITNTTGLTFAWSNGVTTPTATYSITQSQIVSLTVGNPYCGTSTQSICVNYVAASCDGSYPSLSSSLSSFTATNQTYRVASNATITISGVVYFNGCSLLMSTGSVINVTPGSSLIFSDSKLYSCDGMWYGIKTLYNATSVGIVEFRNTSVEDAYKAVDADNTINTLMPIIYANGNSKFNKNYIDFSLDHTVVHTGLNTTFYLEQISMTSQTSTTSPGSNLKCSNYYNPTIKARSYAGIYAGKAGDLAVTSNTVFGNNVFKNKDYGMYLNKTNADVYNANFIDMTSFKDSPICDINGCTSPLPYGIGIFSTNAPKYLNVKPLGSSTTVNTTFSNVGYSILANKTPTVDVQYCSFDNPLQSSSTNFITGLETSIGNTAVYLLDVNGTARVNKNTINKTYTGISLNYSVTTTAANFLLSVGQNTLTAGTGTLTTGIDIVSVLTTPFNGTITNQVVAANTITNARSTGVRLQNVTGGLRVSGNTISLTSANGIKDGILLNGNNNNVRVDNNTIDGNLTGAGVGTYNINSCGIRSINSAGCKIQCNTVKQIGKGIEYNGGNSSPGDGFFKNTLQYPIRRGLVLSNGGLIGMQGSPTGSVVGASANVWTGAWPTPASTLEPQQTLVGGGAALSDAANSPLWVRSTEVPFDNYFTAPSSIFNRYNFTTTTFTTAIVNDYTTCPTGLTQGAKLASTSSSGNSIEDRDADFVKYITTLLPAASSSLTPQDKYMLKQFMFDDLTQSPSSNATLVNFYNQQQNTAIDAYADIDDLLASGNINLANSKNGQASTSNDINQTQHDFNTLYINGINSQADFDQLSDLAKLCPNQYGNAVFQARALLQILTYQYVEYTDSCYTDKLNARFGYDDEVESSISVSGGVQAKIYPNPNNGTFMLAYDLKKYNEAAVQILDVTGKIVFNADIDNMNSILNINTNQLQSGIYFIQLTKGKQLLWTDKVMIQK